MAIDGRCREAASDTEDTEAQRNAEEFRPHEWIPAFAGMTAVLTFRMAWLRRLKMVANQVNS